MSYEQGMHWIVFERINKDGDVIIIAAFENESDCRYFVECLMKCDPRKHIFKYHLKKAIETI